MKLENLRQGVGTLWDRWSTVGSACARWRVLQCAYGSFLRSVPLPAAVKGDQARATYRDGVLKVELPKLEPHRPSVMKIAVG